MENVFIYFMPIPKLILFTIFTEFNISIESSVSSFSNLIPRRKFSAPWNAFDKEKVIDEGLKPYEDLIIEFWKTKKGHRSEKAFNLLIGDYGLLGIKKKYGLQAVKEQLEEGIACKWASITLKKYEMYGRPKNADKEPVTGHPAQRVWKDGGFID